METEVTHESDARRFVLMFDGHAGVLDYHVADGVMSITHTRVPEAIVGSSLVVVAQNAVGFVNVFKFALGFLIPRITVGVVFHG